MKIAFCTFGQPRYIGDDISYRTHYENIFKHNDVDVFNHFWFDENETEFTQSSWSHSHNLTVHPDTVNIVKRRYIPVDIEYEKQKQFKISKETREIANNLPDSRFSEDRNIFNVMSQLYSIKKSIELCEKHIEKTKVEYDFIILTRLDVLIYRFPHDLSVLEKGKLYFGDENFPGFNDYIQVFDPKFIKAMKTYDYFNESLSKCVSLCIEEMKQVYLQKHFLYSHNVRYTDLIHSEIKRM